MSMNLLLLKDNKGFLNLQSTTSKISLFMQTQCSFRFNFDKVVLQTAIIKKLDAVSLITTKILFILQVLFFPAIQLQIKVFRHCCYDNMMKG